MWVGMWFGGYVSVGGFEGGVIRGWIGSGAHVCVCAYVQSARAPAFDELTKRALLKRASLLPNYFPCIASIPKPMPASMAHAGVQHVAMRLPE